MSVPRVQSVARGVTLLQAIADRPRGASTAALARAAGLAPATAGRLLVTLEDAGMVRRGPAGWVVGAELPRLVRRAQPVPALARRAEPLLARLAAEGRESAMLATPAPGPAVEIVAQADGPWLLGLTNWVGRTVALHASAAGKLVLAELPDPAVRAWAAAHGLRRFTTHTITDVDRLLEELHAVRAQGWADLREESESGLASVAVPVRDAAGELVAMLGYSGPSARLDRAALLARLEGAVLTA